MLAMSMERECYADERSPQYSSKKPPHAILYSDESQDVEKELQRLQRHFLSSLDKISVGKVEPGWQAISWERDGGEHGGGNRYQKLNTPLFQNASVNFSAVHFEDKKKYPIDCATALSVILHPHNPYAPSLHFHISYVEPKGKTRAPYWRMIVDLNPSMPLKSLSYANLFESVMKRVVVDSMSEPSRGKRPRVNVEQFFKHAVDFGNKYFYIPSLRKHRGVFHFFAPYVSLENVPTPKAFARKMGDEMIETYVKIVQSELEDHEHSTLTEDDFEKQLLYHTMYFMQVMTLDRGTTHGILAHDQNDIGTLGSLPNFIDCEQLRLWATLLESPQCELLEQATAVLERTGGHIDDQCRKSLAAVIRRHFKKYGSQASQQQAEFNVAEFKSKTFT